jgi:transcriptional regulator with XRE-family HTH domain
METIGDRIRKQRKELRMTQGQLGHKSGLGTATISGLELGTQHGTTKLHKIAEALRCRVEWLETGALPVVAVDGVREVEIATEYSRRSVHGVLVTREGAEVGAEWDKIEGDEYKKLAREFIEGLVAAQKRAARLPTAGLTSRAKQAKNKPPAKTLE